MTPLIEAVARAIAIGMGNDFDHAFASKTEWNEARGEKGGLYRDINEPMQGDYVDAATAALTVILDVMGEPSEGAISEGKDVCFYEPQQCGDAVRAVWSAMLAAFRKETLR